MNTYDKSLPCTVAEYSARYRLNRSLSLIRHSMVLLRGTNVANAEPAVVDYSQALADDLLAILSMHYGKDQCWVPDFRVVDHYEGAEVLAYATSLNECLRIAREFDADTDGECDITFDSLSMGEYRRLEGVKY